MAGASRGQGSKGDQFLRACAKAFYMLTHFEGQLFEQHAAAAIRAPAAFRRFCGHSSFAAGTSKKKQPRLDQQTCSEAASALCSLKAQFAELLLPRWQFMAQLLFELVDSLVAREQHLLGQAAAAVERRGRQFVRRVANSGQLEVFFFGGGGGGGPTLPTTDTRRHNTTFRSHKAFAHRTIAVPQRARVQLVSKYYCESPKQYSKQLRTIKSMQLGRLDKGKQLTSKARPSRFSGQGDPPPPPLSPGFRFRSEVQDYVMYVMLRNPRAGRERD